MVPAMKRDATREGARPDRRKYSTTTRIAQAAQLIASCTRRVTPPLQEYKVNTFLTHRWVVKVNDVEVHSWIISEREETQKFVISKSSLAL